MCSFADSSVPATRIVLCQENGRQVFDDGERDLRVVEECGGLDSHRHHKRDDGPCHRIAEATSGGRRLCVPSYLCGFGQKLCYVTFTVSEAFDVAAQNRRRKGGF